MHLAIAERGEALKQRFGLPPAVPPFGTRAHHVFSFIWWLAFLLAVAGPSAGIYFRYTSPENNSQLMLGSRAGFGTSPSDATEVRFTIGPYSREAGLRRGDKIIAIYGLPLPKTMPVTEEVLAEHSEDPAYIAMGNLLFGTDDAEVPVTVRGPDGQAREIVLHASEQHIEAAARSFGLSSRVLKFIDILHVLFYPFLLFAAWILHRRNARDAVSSVLSLAVLLTISAEQPSATFLATIGVPREINVAIFDLGNICLLAGILLFPHGILTTRVLLLLVSLPLLMFLHGAIYQAFFIGSMFISVLMLLRCLRNAPSSDLRQQIRWALLGFSGYALLRAFSVVADSLKWSTDAFGTQMLVEMLAGLSFATGFLILQLGLLVALLRYRLYDAEVVISRTVSVAIVTLVISGGFAAVMEGIITGLQFLYPETESSQMLAAMAGAIFAASCLEPVRDRVRHWTERRFEKNLFLLREDLPELVRDLRQTASLQEMVDNILTQVDEGVRSVRSAAIVNDRVYRSRGISSDEVEAWKASKSAQDYTSDICEQSDRIFPIRVPLIPSSGDDEPIGYLLVGPRPDRSVPSRAEQKALAGVAETVARGIRTVVRREAREQEVLDLISAMGRRIEQVEAVLSGESKRRPRTA